MSPESLMQEEIGFVCSSCDTFSEFGVAECRGCGQSFVAKVATSSAAQPTSVVVKEQAAQLNEAGTLTKEEPMEQTRHYVCEKCSTAVPVGHKFCGRCGEPVPERYMNPQADFFGTMQAPGKARLLLIRGEGNMEGLSYLLQGTEHIAGRKDGQILFPNDSWLNPRHANIYYSNDKLMLRDEGSVNGLYVRVRQPMRLEPGQMFLCGEQVFKLEATPKDDSGPAPDGTYFYASPKRPSPFRLVQVLRGGALGMVYCARENSIQIGRDDSDMNFPDDIYMSANHAKVTLGADGQFTLSDNGSKNGTYTRIQKEAELQQGDYLFLGKQLLRVEMTA